MTTLTDTRPEDFWVGDYRADYLPLSDEELAEARLPEVEEMFRNSVPVNRWNKPPSK